MRISKKWIILLVLVAFGLTGVLAAGCGGNNKTPAQTAKPFTYPEKPVNMIIAFTAGGASDVQGRLMQKYWDKYVNQPWVFQYKTGAGGAIGFAEIAKAKPDGYTIGGINVPHIVLQPIGQGAQFKIEDFTYICQVVNDPQALVVKKGSPFKSVQDVIQYAKANPEKMKAGIVGTFSGTHMALLEFQDQANIKMTQIAYKGAADQNAALLGGELDILMGSVSDAMRSLDMMTVLAVTSEKRDKFLPDVPTFKELSLDVRTDIRRGYVVPKNTDPAIVKFLHDTFKKIAEDPQYIKDMEKAGQPAEYMSGEDFEKYVFENNKKSLELLNKFNLLKK